MFVLGPFFNRTLKKRIFFNAFMRLRFVHTAGVASSILAAPTSLFNDFTMHLVTSNRLPMRAFFENTTSDYPFMGNVYIP